MRIPFLTLGPDLLAVGGVLLISVSLAAWDPRAGGLFFGACCLALGLAWARLMGGGGDEVDR